jgi:hypothetical protein
MEQERMKWNRCGVAVLAGTLALAPFVYAQNDTGASGAGQENPAALLKTAKELIQAHKLSQAEELCNRLVDKGGTLAADAQELKKQIAALRTCEQDYARALNLSSHRECAQAIDIQHSMQQLCPDFSGVAFLESTLRSRCPAPQRPAELDQGIELFNQQKYSEAEELFASLQPRYPNFPEIESWLQRTRVELLVPEIKASEKRGDLGQAREQLQKLAELAPEDSRIPELRTEIQRLSRPKQADQGKDRAGARDTLVDDAIQEFYAGHFLQADQLLDEYLGQPGKYKALAYFYRGAIVCTDYFLTGAKDEQKQALARDFFSKARQADRKFTPPEKFISPKIIAVYDKTAAGS